ncbi:unnamed protein product, partial [Taenia asiatica]|uniref:Peptidase_M14 domain-containing protein n=1 Tax=Taenia asiatica TaxID=60517 RepID=A0A0R3WGJ6_TAEAS
DRPEVSFNSPIFNPNIDSSYGSHCTAEYGGLYDSWDEFGGEWRVIAGLPVKGRRFPPNTAWFEWARDNGCLPTEEKNVGESRNVMETKSMLDQKGSEVIVAYTNTAASEDDKDSANETVDASSDTASDTTPSFAKMRYLFDPEDESSSWDPYAARWSPFEVESHRVLIWHPANDHNTDAYSVFYFIEFLGTEHHRNELGEHYNTLFIGNVLREYQSHPESRQTSSNYSCYGSSLHLDNMCKINKSVRLTLTADFCLWSAQGGKGKQALFGGPFFEDNRRRGNFTCFLDEDGDDDSASQCLALLFDSAYSDHEEHCTRLSESSEADVQSGTMVEADSLLSNSDALFTEEYDNNVSEFDEESEETSSFASSLAYKDALSPLSPLLNLMRHCASPTPRLTGVLWMTPLDAISPFYRVPIPTSEEQAGSEIGEYEGVDGVYPTPLRLRFLAVVGLVTNWVA